MKKLLGNWWFLTGMAVLCLVLVFCAGLPLFVLALSPLWLRLVVFVLIVGTWGLIAWLRLRKRRKAAAAIAAELSAPSAADEESRVVSARMTEALATLRTGGASRRDYLYDRPWYVIIGPPSAGKTTALVNSGLRFPLADQSLSGIGGTRNLDFWFADEAVLVDTAGRYTTQDSDAGADMQGWKSFLAMLRKQRPLSPINGVIVALGVDELLSADRAGLDRHASLIRRRLAELKESLEVTVPVYLFLTKADLIAGFAEFYDDLDVEGRRAVLGATLPVKAGRPKLDSVLSAFDQMVAAQQQRQVRRLYEEVDQTRRSLILGFPSQLGALRNRLARLVDGAFVAGDKPTGTLRGFYFTSGVQQGAPLDRILAGVAETYQARTGAVGGSSGRAYFLNRALTEVMVPEAGLVVADPAARRRQAARTSMGVAAIAAVVAVVLVLWGVSFFQNRTFLSHLGESSAQAATLTRETGVDLVQVRDSDPDLEQSLGVLNALRNLPQGYAAQQAGEPGLFKRFGLYQSSHADAAAESYRDGLRRIMLPRLILRLEKFMAANGGDPMSLYRPLKVYLMLGGQHAIDAETVRSWVEQDWANQQFPGADRAEVRKELGEHLDALLADPDLAADWPSRQPPLDGTAISGARTALGTLSLADRAYAVLKQKAMSGGDAPWRASAALTSGDAQAFANGNEVLGMEVPFLYTRSGYEKAYLPGLATIAEDLKNDIWVLGQDAQAAGIQAQLEQIRPGVAAAYARDYIAAWDRVTGAPKPAAYFTNNAALGAFTKAPSPLKTLLVEVRKNTTFTGGAANAVGNALTAKLGSSTLSKAALAAGSNAASGGTDAAAEIAAHFKGVQDYVGDGKTPAPIDDFVAAVRQAGVAVISARSTGGGMGADATQAQVATSMATVQASSGSAPPQLQGFVSSATTGGVSASNQAAQGALGDAYGKTVLPACQMATQDKYPFVGTAPIDASVVDVQHVFGFNGTFDAFLTQRIAPLLDTSGPVWRWQANNPQVASFNPSTPDYFAKAQQIRDLLAGGLDVKIAPKAFGAGVDAVEFVAGNTKYRFERADAGGADRPVSWSAQGNLPQASVTLFSGTQKVGETVKDGPWALFRLLDAAQKQNAGPQALLATFGSGAQTAVLKITLPNDHNPFGRGGLWSFRCPAAL